MSRIIDMIAQISAVGGLVTSNRFAVEITPPASLNALNAARTLPFLCDTTNLPGSSFSIESVKHKGYGVGEKRPTSMEFDDITTTFFIDSNSIVLGFLQKWMQLVYSFDPNHSGSLVNGSSSETFSYPEEYWATMVIHVKNAADDTVITYTMDKVYPTNLGAVTLGWENNDSLARIPVTFTYRTYSTTQTISTASEQNVALQGSNSSADLSGPQILNNSVENVVNAAGRLLQI